jgi:uncharacterized membrane protein YgcG
MALLSRSPQSELPESQVEFHEESTAKRWVTLLVYIFLALVVAVLVVLAGRWVYHKVHNSNGPNPAPVAPQGTSQGITSPNSTNKSKSGTSSGNSSSGSSNSGNSSPNNSSSNSSNSSNSSGGKIAAPSPSPSNLPNNGPGDVAALFVGSSAVAAGLHYMIRTRRNTNF